MLLQIKCNLYTRQGQAITYFKETLPAPQSDLAQQTIKDPYLFDFLNLTDDIKERDIENQVIDNVSKFLLTGQRICFYWETIPLGGSSARLLPRSTILPSKTQMLCGNRTKKHQVHTRVCREAKLLFIRSR